MLDNLVGYLLGALEIEELVDVQQTLEIDAELRRQVEILRSGLAPLAGDRSDVDIPTGLAIRTCRRICQVRISSKDRN